MCVSVDVLLFQWILLYNHEHGWNMVSVQHNRTSASYDGERERGMEQTTEKVKKGLAQQDRRYVGSKETIAYVAFDVSKHFNINMYEDRFIFDVLKIDLRLLALIKTINSIWDILNDPFTGAIVDKTRTRWGKFKPYLVVFAIPGTLFTCIYWMMPLFFNDDPMNMTKFAAWLTLALLREGASTFQGISQTGMLATITPHPLDRARLITKANFFAGPLKGMPDVIMGLMIDMINHNMIKGISMQTMYVGMGLFTTISCSVLALWFFLTSRERVVQSEETPSIREGVRSILNNKPILLITLSNFLGAFSINAGMSNYYIDVLGSASYKNLVNLPSGALSNLSYLYVNWARRRFSSKTLWIVGGSLNDILSAGVFFIGSIGGKADGIYRKASYMVPILMLKDTIWMLAMAIHVLIPPELFNEAMDYCEWKNGYRTEGMTSVAQGLAQKLVASVSSVIKPLLMQSFGYDQTKGFGKQSDSTKYALFAMVTIIPFVTGGFLAIIPKLFYDLSGEKKELMYEELLARRAQAQSEISAKE